MKIFCNSRKFEKSRISSKKFVVTIGVFDGVHRGHQKIIRILKKRAKACRALSLLVTFYPHPANVINAPKKVPLLISLKHRLSLIGDMGVDCIMLLRFTKKLSRMSAEGFMRKILGKIHVAEIVVGENFLFGRGKIGSVDDLREFSKIYRYKVRPVSTYKANGKAISSTRIRQLILKGKLGQASGLLSRPVAVLGTVVRGERRGRFIGFPTANIDPHHEAIPPSGVYAVMVRRKGKLYRGILNIGTRPTFEKGPAQEAEPTIEAHIFNFRKSIYGEDLEIIFAKKIRDEKKFRNLISLRQEIKRDSARAGELLREGWTKY